MAIAVGSVAARVEIDGAELQRDVVALLEQVVVDDNLHRADMVMLAFRDLELNVLETARIRIGGKIKVSASGLGDVAPSPIFAGEVTSIEASYDALGSRAIVRGYDPSHRLAAGRRTETYRNVTDSDIARTIASRNQLRTGTIDETAETMDHVSQANQTDLEFLRGRARRIGYEMLVADDALHFRKPTESSTAPSAGTYRDEDPLKLVYRHNLLEFRARVSAVGQPAEVKVRGWDPANKQAIIGQSTPTAAHVQLSTTPVKLAGLVGGGQLVAVDRPQASQGAADAAAQALGEVVGSAAFEATGVALGTPELRAGVAINVSGVGATFDGRYVVTSVRHAFGDVAYRSTFEVTGRDDRSLQGLIASAGGAGGGGGGGGGGSRVYGVVVAIVTNNDDPEKLGRVKVKFPWLSDSYESDWARLAVLGAGPDSGTVWIPEVNDEVLVAFEHGDVSRPYVVGALWNGVDKPPLGDGLMDGGAITRRGFVSRLGHKVVFFDSDSKSGVAMLTSDGKFKVSLNATTGEVHISADGKIRIEATQDISIDAKGRLELGGQTGIAIKSSGTVDVDGATITLN